MRLDPSYFFLQYTSMCNSKCTTCHLWNLEPQTLSVEQVDRIGIFLDPAHIRSVYLTGGEPLLPANCVEIAKSLDRWRPGVSIISSTNGICPDLYLARVKDMLSAGLHIRFQVSLNGLKETHDKSRGTPGNYENAIKTARGLCDLGILASLNILMMPETTGHDLRHVADLARELGVPAWSSPILRHNEWFGEPDDGAKVPVIADCRGGFDAFTIRYNGDITACQEPRPGLVFGNLRDECLDEGRVREIQASIKRKECQPCGCCTNAFTDGIYVS